MPGPTPGIAPLPALPAALAECRRVVAVTVGLPELLLDAAGLLQRFGAAGVQTDVLVAAATDDRTDSAAAAGLGELRVSGLARHRLGLPAPFGADRADDLLAAMSELVGFDPEPGVFCLAPSTDGREPSRATVGAAAERIAGVYRLPLVRFSATADDASADLELNADEWTRKCAGLAACATQVLPLSGRREYFTLRAAVPRP
ncbi:MAG TPA: hypothetical protein VGH89_21885 [Pseudonocardia sp.]